MTALTEQELDILDWLKRAEPEEVRSSLEDSWEETLEYKDSFHAIVRFAEEDPYYDEVTLSNPHRDTEVLDYLHSSSAESLFEHFNEIPSEEGKSAYLLICNLIDHGA